MILFGDRPQYVQHLQARQPRIEITLGFYDVSSETSYFFAGPESVESTQLHEVTHQLFQESKTASAKLTPQANFWIMEGIAMYMESLRHGESVARLGGLDARRLQFARYRALQEQFYIPLVELVSMGQAELQRDPRIRRIYSQAAGLVHFLMDGQAGKHRQALLQYLRLVYEGRDRIESLATLTGVALPQLDDDYREFLHVTDQRLADANLQPDTVEALCLGNTSISDLGLRGIPPQRRLTWLDVANLDATDDGLAFALRSEELRQLNLDGTEITDALLPQLAATTTLEELDLSNTAISDRGLKSIAELPQLRVLWLQGTGITDVSVTTLISLPMLRHLGIEGTSITDAGRKQLREAKPDLGFD